MKIVYVDMKFAYGIEERGLNFIGEEGFIKSFQKLGHDVVPFYFDNYLNDTKNLETDLLQFLENEKPNLVWFYFFKFEFDPKTIEKITKKYKTTAWFGDDSWRYEDHSAVYAPYLSTVITTDKFTVEKYIKQGCKKVIHSQWCAIDHAPLFDPNAPLDYKYDVSFVGGTNHFRKWFVKKLNNAGIKVHTFGNGQEHGVVSLEQMIDVFRTSKINLNLSNSRCYDIRYIFSSPVNLAQTIHTKKVGNQLKARNFEISYYGGFQLSDFTAGLEDYYSVGQDLICFSGIDEAILLIKYYLGHDEERERVKRSGFQKSKEFTYYHQLKKVLAQV